MWNAFLHSVECVFILILLSGAGYVTAARGWYDSRSQSLIAKLVTFLSLPAYLFSSVSKSLTHDELLALTGPLVVPFVSVWTCFAISLLIAKVARIERIHHGVFASAFTATNNMFIGLPVSIALFGDEAVVPTLLYFFANTTYFWTMGNFLEAMDGVEATHAKRPKLLSKETVKRVFSPPLVGFLCAIAFILADVQVPGAILSAAQYLGGITTPLALIFIGIMIYTIGVRNIRFDKDLTLVFLGRFVICPLVCLGLTQAFGLSPLYVSVYVIQASLPCITQIAVLAKFHHADTKFATTAVAGTTLASVVTLPVWMMILTGFS